MLRSRTVWLNRVKAWLCSWLVFASGCGLPLHLWVEAVKQANPNMVYGVEASGLAALLPSEELGACGPTREVAALIADCPWPGIACFTAACAGHDLCYSTCGTQQDDCDAAFFWDMVYLCDAATPDFFERDRCYTSAWIYFRAVQEYGGLYFPATQDIVCSLGDAWPIPPAAPADSSSARPMIAPPFLDADGDLIPDDWEVEVGLDPADSADALMDYDQDGLVNLAEFTHGGDPYVP